MDANDIGSHWSDLRVHSIILNYPRAMSWNNSRCCNSNYPLMTDSQWNDAPFNEDDSYIDTLETPKRKQKMERKTVEQYQQEFRQLLNTNIVTFHYRKKNGQLRKAVGTTCLDFVPTDLLPKGIGSQRPEGYVNYYDLTVCGWRTLRLKHVTSYELP